MRVEKQPVTVDSVHLKGGITNTQAGVAEQQYKGAGSFRIVLSGATVRVRIQLASGQIPDHLLACEWHRRGRLNNWILELGGRTHFDPVAIHGEPE